MPFRASHSRFARRLILIALLGPLACDGRPAGLVDPPLDDGPLEPFAEIPILSCDGAPLEGMPWRGLAFGLDMTYARLAERIPGFGGLFLDGERIAAYLTDLSLRHRAEPLLQGFLESEMPHIAGRQVRWLQGRYDWRQLVVWRSCLSERVSGLGVNTTDIRESENRVEFGVWPEEAIETVRAEIARTTVPADAVAVELRPPVCTADLRPSVIVEVRDGEGNPAATGATATIRKPGFEASEEGGFGDLLRIGVARDNEAGVFEVRVERPGHATAVIPGVEVPGDHCGVTEAPVVQATIPLLAGAPSVRQVVLPRSGYGFGASVCGQTYQVPAFVAADPGENRDTVWTSRDPGVVTVRGGQASADGRSTGYITPVCRRTTGETWVVAHAAADPSVRDSVPVTVWGSGR